MFGFSGEREWVYPRDIQGTFTRIHHVSSAGLVFVLAVVPWLRWDGHPIVLADVAARRLTLFGSVFTASDGILIMLLALTAAFSLFFTTSMFGRLWCGYACPQSVFQLNFVLPVERWIEGSRGSRIRHDRAQDHQLRKLLKWAIFLLGAWVVSMCFMGFFVPTEVLWTGGASATEYGVVGFFTFVWFWDFAWAREQVCNYMCPYARFQGALTDDESLVISYTALRGEPRGRSGGGECIDCKACTVVCPQGIDIRDGFQLECIACGRCIDACTKIMAKRDRPTLVHYTTQAEEEGRPHRWVRPRTVVYATLLTVLTGAITWQLVHHTSLELMVARAPGSLYTDDADGFVRNNYLVQLADRGGDAATWAIAVEGLPEGSQVRSRPVMLAAEDHATVPLVVRVPIESAHQDIPITVVVRNEHDHHARTATFKGPRGGH